jgi:hypothetical protein
VDLRFDAQPNFVDVVEQPLKVLSVGSWPLERQRQWQAGLLSIPLELHLGEVRLAFPVARCRVARDGRPLPCVWLGGFGMGGQLPNLRSLSG